MVGQDGDDDGGDQAPSEVDVDGEEVQQVEVELTTGFESTGYSPREMERVWQKGQGNVG